MTACPTCSVAGVDRFHPGEPCPVDVAAEQLAKAVGGRPERYVGALQQALRSEAPRPLRYPCWCDHMDGCDGTATEPFGLCPTCTTFGHGRLPRMGLTVEAMQEMAAEDPP